MTVSVAVMAHPRRTSQVVDLLGALDRPARVAWDRCNDRHDTGIRALEAFDPDCSHHLVVQDDALVCRDLVAGIDAALAFVPDGAPLVGYVGRVKPFRREIERLVAQAGDASWLRMPGIYWGPAIVVPTEHIGEIAAWWQSRAAQKITNYDRRLSAWYQAHGIDAWYPWPSLVDHRGDESLVEGHGAGRRAHRFIGEDASALSVDWSGRVVDVEGAEAMDRARQIRARQVAGRTHTTTTVVVA